MLGTLETGKNFVLLELDTKLNNGYHNTIADSELAMSKSHSRKVVLLELLKFFAFALSLGFRLLTDISRAPVALVPLSRITEYFNVWPRNRLYDELFHYAVNCLEANPRQIRVGLHIIAPILRMEPPGRVSRECKMRLIRNTDITSVPGCGPAVTRLMQQINM